MRWVEQPLRRAAPRPLVNLAFTYYVWSMKEGQSLNVTRDSDYFQRRAEEARAAAYAKDEPHRAEIAGELALAYAALARRRAKVVEISEEAPAIPLEQPA